MLKYQVICFTIPFYMHMLLYIFFSRVVSSVRSANLFTVTLASTTVQSKPSLLPSLPSCIIQSHQTARATNSQLSQRKLFSVYKARVLEIVFAPLSAVNVVQ